jgi:predicted ATP-dependent endonuclease of OLD family
VRVKSFRVKNFRRLKDVRVDLDDQTTIFVGANNSGKTSATHVFQLFLEQGKSHFQIFDFTADCWKEFNQFEIGVGDPDKDLPSITFDLWFEVDDENVHRVVDLLPSLDWAGEPVGVRMVYAPRDGGRLIANYQEALKAAAPKNDADPGSYKPWPETLTDYLTKRLANEYEIKYYLLDSKRCSADLVPEVDYEPFFFGTLASGAASIVNGLIKVDFLDAQRHLSDSESHARSEDLSKRLSRFYLRNLEKIETDLEALSAITDAESRLNDHFRDVFGPTLKSIGELGYPGISNPGLVVKASFNAHSILSTSAGVHYALPDDGSGSGTPVTLPDLYNGLGFKNLIYMAVEILDFHHAWAEGEDQRPPVHLIMIEEPEVHLHAQLQQVFIRKVFELLPPAEPGFTTQMVVTTHSSHILYESDFRPIRYFCRGKDSDGIHCSDVKNLSTFYDDEEQTTLGFLQQYLKLTHCDLFFADAAILVEGNVERLLLPMIIERDVASLRACHLTILEVGGAFAHKFKKLIEFLDLTTLVITDLDSVESGSVAPDDECDGSGKKACVTTTTGAVTSNETLKQWVPALASIEDLLNAGNEAKIATNDAGTERVRAAYQTRQRVSWEGSEADLAGRTLEESFALQNLNWVQDPNQKELGLAIARHSELDLSGMHLALFNRVKTFDKTRFALGLIASSDRSWQSPAYIVEGLTWLLGRLQLDPESPEANTPAEPTA